MENMQNIVYNEKKEGSSIKNAQNPRCKSNVLGGT